MTGQPISDEEWQELSLWISRTMGLHFPPERRDDLGRGIGGAAAGLGFPDLASCVRALPGVTPDQAQLQLLASHLTIGETYFFRDRPVMDALARQILPALIRSRRGRVQSLRLWSAGCASGEEAYTLAILVHQALPDLADWRVTITATDINPLTLRKAVAGQYGEWSFRNLPAGIRERYFERMADGRHALAERIRKLVNFEYLNLVQDRYPCIETDTNAMDIIFCRNVLMYFKPLQVAKVVANLQHSLVAGGWLAVSPAETSQVLFGDFEQVNFPGAIFYRKDDGRQRPAPAQVPAALPPPAPAAAPAAPRAPAPTPGPPALAPAAVARMLCEHGRYAEAADTLLQSFARQPPDRQSYSLLARALANQGQLAPALDWCERWIAADKVDPAGHYLRAIVLLEQGDEEQARTSLRRATFLEPDFVLAHFALGNLARRQGREAEAAKHFANTQLLLQRYRPGDLLPESDGLSADRLAQTLAAIAGAEPGAP